MSSLVQKCVFYRPELTGKWGPHGIEILSFWNASTDRAQRGDDKYGGHLSIYVYFQSYGH